MNNLEIASKLKSEIDIYCKAEYDKGHRNHLGASQIGHECDRHLWYKFRWAHKDEFDGRMHRLFQRGHREETHIIEYLKGIGCKVYQHNPATGKQYQISNVNGHFGGSCDGVAELPPEYGFDKPVLLEFKTSATGKPFADLANGVRQAKPQHYAQMCVYGYHLDLTHALYIVVNKNDDDLYVELIELDRGYGNLMVSKARSIINSANPPKKISEYATYHKCKFCSSHSVCHRNEPYEKNCRSCKYSTPIDNANWFCEKYNDIIPADFISKGCEEYEEFK